MVSIQVTSVFVIKDIKIWFSKDIQMPAAPVYDIGLHLFDNGIDIQLDLKREHTQIVWDSYYVRYAITVTKKVLPIREIVDDIVRNYTKAGWVREDDTNMRDIAQLFIR